MADPVEIYEQALEMAGGAEDANRRAAEAVAKAMETEEEQS